VTEDEVRDKWMKLFPDFVEEFKISKKDIRVSRFPSGRFNLIIITWDRKGHGSTIEYDYDPVDDIFYHFPD